MNALLEPKRAVAPGEADVSLQLEELGTTISASRLGLWLRCTLRFYFTYVLKIKKPPTPAMYSGSTVHAVLQYWNLTRWRREPLTLANFKKVFAELWVSLQQGVQIDWQDGQEAERTSAWRALEHYFTQTPIKANERPEGVEVSAEADLSSHGLPKLIGVIDLIRAGATVVDFKVVGKTPDAQSVVHLHEVQLTCYSVLYRDATGRKESALELHHLVKTKAPKLIISSIPPATAQQHLRLFRQIEAYQAGLARREFFPSPGIHCNSCPHLEACRQWC